MPSVPKIAQAIAATGGCPPDLDDKTLLLKIPYALVTEHTEIKLKLSCDLPLC